MRSRAYYRQSLGTNNTTVSNEPPEKKLKKADVENNRTTPCSATSDIGAGQDVGRSCILLTIGGKNIMLDCGIHMGLYDERRFPDFRYIAEGPLTEHLDCVIISHFHLDHCGALPYMTEVVGYNGPIYMTTPTKAICPILLEDYRKISVGKKKEKDFFSSAMIINCMKRVTTINLHEIIKVDDELQIKAYYAGHVLGAAMFLVKVGSQSVVYTGDFNMTPGRHLGAAWIDKCRPNVLITESTYATTVRDSKRCQEQDFLVKVHDCVERGGKVLIPVFAVGRAQELCIVLESYWERLNLKVPIYFTAGLTETATAFYKMFITWANQNIQKTFVNRNMFDFKHVKSFDRAYIDNPGPMVVFSTPGTLDSGLSLQIFQRWAPNKNNMLIMPGYCMPGTVSQKVLLGAKTIEFENRQIVEVNMAVEYMSCSAHVDAKGIMQLINYCKPEKVLLVHGKATEMGFLKEKITEEMGLECFMPANGDTVTIPTKVMIPIDCSLSLLKRQIAEQGGMDNKKYIILHGVLMKKDDKLTFLDAEDAMAEVGIRPHIFRVTTNVKVKDPSSSPPARIADSIYRMIEENVEGGNFQLSSDASITFKSISIKVDNADDENKNVCISWGYPDTELGLYLLGKLNNFSSCIK